ncbi:S24 family peptidase [Thermaurantiacus sp.]
MVRRREEEEGRSGVDAARARLDALIRQSGASYADISRLLGRNAAYIQQFVRRGTPRRLAEEDRRTLARHFGVSEALLGGPATEESPPPSRRVLMAAGKPGTSEPGQARDYVLVPFLPRATAQAGASEAPGEALAFETAFARSVGSGRLTALVAVHVEGDSMAPALLGGDQLLVDTDDRERLRDGLYVLRLNEALAARRLSVHPVTRRLSLLADNPAYPSFSDCEPQALDIVGRVVWIGRRLS